MARRQDWGSAYYDQGVWAGYAWGPPLGGPVVMPPPAPGREVGSDRSGFRSPFERRHFWSREPVTAGEIMTAPVRAVTREATLDEVAGVMRTENVGIVPVVDEEERLLGVVTDRDLVVRVIARGDDTKMTAGEIMSADIEAARPEESLADVLMRMQRKVVHRIPVVDEGRRLLGIVSTHDIARRADRDPELQQVFRRLTARRSFWTNF